MTDLPAGPDHVCGPSCMRPACVSARLADLAKIPFDAARSRAHGHPCNCPDRCRAHPDPLPAGPALPSDAFVLRAHGDDDSDEFGAKLVFGDQEVPLDATYEVTMSNVKPERCKPECHFVDGILHHTWGCPEDLSPDRHSLVPGPELDRLVRRVVFDDKPDCVWVRIAGEKFQTCIACGLRWPDRMVEPKSCVGCAPYSTSELAMAKVVAKLREKHGDITLRVGVERGAPFCWVYLAWDEGYDDAAGRSSAMPHAVALAALKALRERGVAR